MQLTNILKRGAILFCCYIIFNSCTTNRLYPLEFGINRELNSYSCDCCTLVHTSVQKDSIPFILALDTISSFEWDELLVARPYTDLNKFSEYNLKKFPPLDMNDRFILFGFIYKKKGVKWIELGRYKILDSVYDGFYLKSDSRFVLHK